MCVWQFIYLFKVWGVFYMRFCLVNDFFLVVWENISTLVTWNYYIKKIYPWVVLANSCPKINF